MIIYNNFDKIDTVIWAEGTKLSRDLISLLAHFIGSFLHLSRIYENYNAESLSKVLTTINEMRSQSEYKAKLQLLEQLTDELEAIDVSSKVDLTQLDRIQTIADQITERDQLRSVVDQFFKK